MDNWEKLKITSGVIASVVIPMTIAFVGQEYSTAIKERELQGRFVELAVDVLRSEPTKQSKNLRAWSVDIIDGYSGVPMKADARNSLVEDIPLPVKKVEPPALLKKTYHVFSKKGLGKLQDKLKKDPNMKMFHTYKEVDGVIKVEVELYQEVENMSDITEVK